MDGTVNKNLKLLNNEKYLTFEIQDNIIWSNLQECVKTKPFLISW